MADSDSFLRAEHSSTANRIVLILLAALLTAHFLLVVANFETAISSPDANGYFKQARLLAEDGRSWFRTDSPLQFIASHWVESSEGAYYSKYPPGLPLAIAPVLSLAGPSAALLVNPILSVLTLLGLFLLCRLWTGPWFALWAVAVMAANPLANQHTLWAGSHVAVSFLLVWGVYCLVRWSDKFSMGWGAAAGLLLGAIPSVRYAEAVYGLGLGIFIVVTLARSRNKVHDIAPLAAGAALPLVLMMARSQAAFGAFWKTGYAISGEQTGFGLAFFMQNSFRYLSDILGHGGGITAALALAGVVLMLSSCDSRKNGILLTGLIVPSTLLYVSYYFYPNMGGESWGTLRFLLPTFYLYAVAAAWLLKELNDKFHTGGRALSIAALVFALWWGLPQSVMALSRQQQANKPLAEITETVTNLVPAGAVLIAPRQIQQQLDFTGGWRLADEMFFNSGRMFPGGDRMADSDREGPNPRAGMKERMELVRSFRDQFSDGLSDNLLAELTLWAGSNGDGHGKIYWIGELERIMELVPETDGLRVLAEIELPSTGKMMAGGRPGMGGAMGGPGAAGGRRAMSGGPMGGGMPGRMRDMSREISREQKSKLTLVEWTLGSH
jgi:dolichyl-phosphate-mannose-protein mannosyltransferase